MRNANWTRILTILLSLLALYALLAVLTSLLQRFITPILLVILASIVAFVLTPVVDFLQRRAHMFRWLAILTTYLALATIAAGLGFFMATPLIDQTKALSDAIKNPSTQNLHTVKELSTFAGQFAARAALYEQDTAQTTTDPQTGLKQCSPGPSQCAAAPCYAAYFLGARGTKANPSAIWSGSGCANTGPNAGSSNPWLNWRTSGILHPFRTIPTLYPKALDRLTSDLSELSQTSIKSKPVGGGKQPGGTGKIPTTQVPPSFDKPVRKDLTKLRHDITQAVQDVQLERNTQFSTDAGQVLKDTQVLADDSTKLYKKVKNTPIIVMAFQNFFDGHHIPINVGSAISSAISKVRGQGTTALNNAVAILTGTLNVIFDLIVVLIMSLYLLADGGRFIGWLLRLVPESNREQAWFFLGSLNKVLGGYIRGQLIVAITVGLLAGVGCWIIGVPYALLLGIFAFLAESIPVMGPVIASVPAILVALFTLPLLQTIIVVGWFIVIQQIEQNVVGPRITGHAVGIHPVVAMIAVIVGLEIGGIWGAFLAVPVAGILFVVVGEAYNYVVLRRPLPTAEVPESMEIDDTGAQEPVGG